MFYETQDQSRAFFNRIGLSFNPFKALVAPRPIGWISTVDTAGVPNLAPYSFFNAVSSDPPMVYFSSGGPHAADGGEKDSLRNIRATAEFVCNVVPWALREEMNASSTDAPHGVDEIALLGLPTLPSTLVRPPRVAGSPVHLECRLHQIVELPVDPVSGHHNTMVIGHVVGIHIDDACIVDGRYDTVRARPVARLGYQDYAVVEEAFVMKRPPWPLAPESEAA